MDGAKLKPTDTFEYYIPHAIYWNDFKTIQEHHNRLVSGQPEIGWVRHVRDAYGARDAGLFVSCGNGWVDRDCFDMGLVKRCVGFDVLEPLLDDARRGAAARGMPAEYFAADGNQLDLGARRFDLIVNHGSIHHIAYLDRLMRQLRASLTQDGLYVMLDYTGPHRNQYSWDTWQRTILVNNELPREYQVPLRYPHIKTMLLTDPTEAIHSELEMEVTGRYFDIEREVRYGGAIAYTLLYYNNALHRDQHTKAGARAIELILAEDQAFLDEHPSSNLLTFAVCRPRPKLPAQSVLDRWTAEENERESNAARNGGRYYKPTPLELLYRNLEELRGPP